MTRKLALVAVAGMLVGAWTICFDGGISFAVAEEDGKATSTAYLLDRGDAAAPSGAAAGTPGTATLAVGAATPMIAPGAFVFAPAVATGAILGNLFGAPMDFPTGWHPFWITGVFAFAANMVVPLPVAAGAAVVSVATPMALFVAAGLTVPGPTAVTPPGALVNAAGAWAGSPMGPLPVLSGQLVLAGAVLSVPALQGLGGVMTPSAPRPLYWALPSPMAAVVVSPMLPPGEYIAGAYVSGAAVPVELQAFHVE